jgi:hypothetical protein
MSLNNQDDQQNIDNFKTDIFNLQEHLRRIDEKVDEIIDILGNLSVIFAEDDEEDEYRNIYDTDQSWLPEEDSDWENMDDEEY